MPSHTAVLGRAEQGRGHKAPRADEGEGRGLVRDEGSWGLDVAASANAPVAPVAPPVQSGPTGQHPAQKRASHTCGRVSPGHHALGVPATVRLKSRAASHPDRVPQHWGFTPRGTLESEGPLHGRAETQGLRSEVWHWPPALWGHMPRQAEPV